jgi:hypothetical protein
VNIDPVGVWPSSRRSWKFTVGAVILLTNPADCTKFCSTCQTGRPTFIIAPGPGPPVPIVLLQSSVTKEAVASSVALVVPYSAMN